MYLMLMILFTYIFIDLLVQVLECVLYNVCFLCE